MARKLRLRCLIRKIWKRDRNSGYGKAFSEKNKKEKILEVQGVFIEVGYEPATSYAKGLVEFNKRDEIKVKAETCETSTPGVFAAGDLNEGQFKQIVTAAGEGAKAALAAHTYIKHKTIEK